MKFYAKLLFVYFFILPPYIYLLLPFFNCIYHVLSSLEMKSDEAFRSAQQFYKDLGDIAVEKGYA
jgi:hypothetical protein